MLDASYRSIPHEVQVVKRACLNKDGDEVNQRNIGNTCTHMHLRFLSILVWTASTARLSLRKARVKSRSTTMKSFIDLYCLSAEATLDRIF